MLATTIRRMQRRKPEKKLERYFISDKISMSTDCLPPPARRAVANKHKDLAHPGGLPFPIPFHLDLSWVVLDTISNYKL